MLAGEHARHEALEYARALVQRHRIACSWAEYPGAGLVLRCLGLGGLWRRHTRVHAGLWLRRRTPEGGYLSTRERQEIALGCSGEFARALGLPGLEVDLNGRHSVPGVSKCDDACVLLAGGEPVAAVTYNMLGRPYSVRRDFWDCIVMLMAQVHPSPPAELAACASLVLAQGEVCLAWRKEGSP